MEAVCPQQRRVPLGPRGGRRDMLSSSQGRAGLGSTGLCSGPHAQGGRRSVSGSAVRS